MMSALIDNEIRPAEKESLTHHIHACDDCRALYEEMLSVHDLFATAGHHKAPENFPRQVMAKLEAEMESGSMIFPKRIPLFLKLAEIGFAIAIVIVGIISGNILMMNSHRPERPHGIESSFSLDAFDPVPSNSLGGTYVAMTEVRNEK